MYVSFRATLIILAGCCAGIAQQGRAGEELPPELGITEVTGSQHDNDTDRMPASVVRMDFDSHTGDPISDAGDVARYQPGVSIPADLVGADPNVPYGNNGFTSYQIRGVGGNRILMTIDGIRQPPEFEQSGGMGRTFFDPRVYGGVDILKGPGSAQYGSEALGGAVMFRSKSLTEELEYSPEPWLLRGSTTLKSVDQSINGLLSAGVRGDDMYITVSESYTEGQEVENAKGDVDANPLDYQQNHVLGTISWIPDEQNRVWLTAENFVYQGDTQLHSSEVGDVVYAASQHTNERSRISFDYVSTPDSGWWDRLAVKTYFQKAESESINHRNSFWVDPAPPGFDPLTNDLRRTDHIGFDHELIGTTAGVQHFFDTGAFEHELNYGLELGYEHAENAFQRDIVYNEAPSPSSSPNAFDPSDLYRFEAYVEDAVSRGRWNVIGGVRLIDYTISPGNDPDYLAATGTDAKADYHNFAVSPSVSADYLLSRNAMLWARYAHNVRNPSLENYVGYFDHGDFEQLPNPGLKEETADGFEVGFKGGGGAVSFDTSVYYTYYQDFIEEVILSSSSRQVQNVGNVEIYGVEAGIDYRLGNCWALLDGFSTGIRAVWSDGYNRTDEDAVNSVDPFEAVLYFAYDHASGKWGSRITGIYHAEKDNVSDDWTWYVPPASFVVDWTGYWNITKRISIEAAIRNLTDEKYWLWPNAGRVDHADLENPELAVQPGINGLLTLNVAF
ncbi:TonB-dependent receptor domain-containing protein [Pontiella agarivorans]|uniref:TonB-dependent receptor n=1 Tax=Pontiella agarivorans TaxID=3038953 RepID=A0ABU5MVG9_9BACT|nr:TonB-dependent receptor [Pontiella agarivorans]MDZ8118162.1 TonB-dependent receptor [Pontiella agarivorans]